MPRPDQYHRGEIENFVLFGDIGAQPRDEAFGFQPTPAFHFLHDHQLCRIALFQRKSGATVGAKSRRCALDGHLHVLRIDIAPAENHHFLAAPGDEQLAFTHKTDIAGAQPFAFVAFHPGAERLLARSIILPPVPLRDRRTAQPYLADLALALPFQRDRIDDRHVVPIFMRAADRNDVHGIMRPIARYDPPIFQRRFADAHGIRQCASSTMHIGGGQQYELGHAIRRHHRLATKAVSGEFLGELRHRLEADTLGAIHGDIQAAQIELLYLGVGNLVDAELERKIRGAGETGTIAGNQPQPAYRTHHEGGRRELYAVRTGEHRHDDGADQAEIVMRRQPEYEGLTTAHIEHLLEKPQIGQQVVVRHHHALGRSGGAGGVLQKHDIRSLCRRRHPRRLVAFGIVRRQPRHVPQDVVVRIAFFHFHDAVANARQGQRGSRL
ncbi:hypothetical protein GCM10010981_33450 [Dyella nitratireducens]|uniref:Uncharacterized protein n=1 Tax=Dyella nitratireducens TaxID=1849580 RepID=A0ABQ1GDL2_9GAMM|nr:hypothetical protein GCM10010981_33450 [Dyella nitratireducens]